jgi:hypothetical protein
MSSWASLQGFNEDLHAVFQVQLGQNVLDVFFSGAWGDLKYHGDLRIRLSLNNPGIHLALATRQVADRLFVMVAIRYLCIAHHFVFSQKKAILPIPLIGGAKVGRYEGGNNAIRAALLPLRTQMTAKMEPEKFSPNII